MLRPGDRRASILFPLNPTVIPSEDASPSRGTLCFARGCPTHRAVLKFASIMLCVRDVWELKGRAPGHAGEHVGAQEDMVKTTACAQRKPHTGGPTAELARSCPGQSPGQFGGLVRRSRSREFVRPWHIHPTPRTGGLARDNFESFPFRRPDRTATSP